MSFGRLHKLVSYLIAGLGLVSLALGSELSVGVEVAIAIAYVASFFAEGALIHDARWIRGWNIGLLALVAIEIARGATGSPILPLALELVAALQISRLMNRRSAREHQHIAALALLHLVAATVLSAELAYAFVFLGFVVVAPWMLALSHLRSEIEGQLGARADGARSIERVLASKRVVGAGFLGGTAALALPLFAMTGLVFVAFPRVGLGFLTFGQSVGQRMSGFGANVELGDFGVIRTDPTVVLRVTPPDLPADPPEHLSIRMRGTSFDHYDGRRWTRGRTSRARGVGRVGNDYAVPRRMPIRTRDRAWTIVLDPLEEPVVFTPPGTVGLEIPPRVVGGLEVGRDIQYTPGIDVRYGDPDGLGLRYTAWTSDDPRDRETGALDVEELRRYLEVPPAHRRVAALARRWTRGAPDDLTRVRMLLAKLRDSGEYTYSLHMPNVGARPPLEVFLLSAKHGHCEYFSTALAIMARTLGIPARNVTGFLGGTLNRYGGYYALSQGDAHSWVEVWLPQRGWVTVDPTPPSRDEIVPDDGWVARMREMVDALRTRWAHDIVGYDLRSQVTLFRGVREWVTGLDTDEPPSIESSTSLSRVRPPSWVAIALGVLVALVIMILLVRRRARRSSIPEAAHEAVVLYRALDTALARLGHPRPRERTPLEHVSKLEEAGFAELALVREVTQHYLDARYGGRVLERAVRDRLAAAVAALAKRRDLSVSARMRLP